jgi:hypothetical protein
MPHAWTAVLSGKGDKSADRERHCGYKENEGVEPCSRGDLEPNAHRLIVNIDKKIRLRHCVPQMVDDWCPGPELNRYVLLRTRDFKSRASASFATRAS